MPHGFKLASVVKGTTGEHSRVQAGLLLLFLIVCVHISVPSQSYLASFILKKLLCLSFPLPLAFLP